VGRCRVGTTVKVGFVQSFDAGWMRLWDVSAKGEWLDTERDRECLAVGKQVVRGQAWAAGGGVHRCVCTAACCVGR
jgi:hypothetical protein